MILEEMEMQALAVKDKNGDMILNTKAMTNYLKKLKLHLTKLLQRRYLKKLKQNKLAISNHKLYKLKESTYDNKFS